MQDLQSENIKMRSLNEILRGKNRDQELEAQQIKAQLAQIQDQQAKREEELTQQLVEKEGELILAREPKASEEVKQDVAMTVEEKPDPNYKTLLACHDQQVSTMHDQIASLQSLVTDLLAHFKIYSSFDPSKGFEDSKVQALSQQLQAMIEATQGSDNVAKAEHEKLKEHYNKMREVAKTQKDMIIKMQASAKNLREKYQKLEAEHQAQVATTTQDNN